MAEDSSKPYWKKIAGVELFKLDWHFKRLLYRFFGIRLPKLADQKNYWERRGRVYRSEICSSGYLDREIFFQDMLIDELRQMDFSGFFEAGCGFGWNIARVRREFPDVFVGGVDFSFSQLMNLKEYAADLDLPAVNGDAIRMPFRDNAFDVGFSLGVFMNIHPSRITSALGEMIRVCKKYVIHIEYDENHTTPELKSRRAFKTNIVSHDYSGLYRELGVEVVKFRTYKDFGGAYDDHARKVASRLERWEGFEGPEKYILIIVDVQHRE